MEKPDQPEEALRALLMDLLPEELEPRLELQLSLDPLSSLGPNNNQNIGNQQQQQQRVI